MGRKRPAMPSRLQQSAGEYRTKLRASLLRPPPRVDDALTFDAEAIAARIVASVPEKADRIAKAINQWLADLARRDV
jgi:hypothetical protein